MDPIATFSHGQRTTGAPGQRLFDGDPHRVRHQSGDLGYGPIVPRETDEWNVVLTGNPGNDPCLADLAAIEPDPLEAPPGIGVAQMSIEVPCHGMLANDDDGSVGCIQQWQPRGPGTPVNELGATMQLSSRQRVTGTVIVDDDDLGGTSIHGTRYSRIDFSHPQLEPPSASSRILGRLRIVYVKTTDAADALQIGDDVDLQGYLAGCCRNQSAKSP